MEIDNPIAPRYVSANRAEVCVNRQKMPYLNANWMHAQIAGSIGCFQRNRPRHMFQYVALDLERQVSVPKACGETCGAVLIRYLP